jgi:hypothetical protein
MLENLYVNRQKGFSKIMQDLTQHCTKKINQKIDKDMKTSKRKPEVKQGPVKRKKSDTVSLISESFDFPQQADVKKAKPQNKKNKLKFV